MKSNVIEKPKEKKVALIPIDPSLNRYSSMVIFPKKMEKLKEAIEKYGIPKPEDFSR